jgi:hypothetical protein
MLICLAAVNHIIILIIPLFTKPQMGFKLDKVIPWGRSLDEYIAMFHLTSSDRELAILDSASGPASFNVEMTQQGKKSDFLRSHLSI